MALADLLNLSNKNKKIGLSEERVRAIIPAARQYIAFGENILISSLISSRLAEILLVRRN